MLSQSMTSQSDWTVSDVIAYLGLDMGAPADFQYIWLGRVVAMNFLKILSS